MFCGKLKTLCNCSLSVIWTIIHHFIRLTTAMTEVDIELFDHYYLAIAMQCIVMLCHVRMSLMLPRGFSRSQYLTNRAQLVDVNSILTHTKNLISCCFQVSNSNFTIFNVDGHVLPTTKWPYGSWWFSPKYVHHQWWSIIVSPRTKSKLPPTASSLSSPSSSSL